MDVSDGTSACTYSFIMMDNCLVDTHMFNSDWCIKMTVHFDII